MVSAVVHTPSAGQCANIPVDAEPTPSFPLGRLQPLEHVEVWYWRAGLLCGLAAADRSKDLLHGPWLGDFGRLDQADIFATGQ